MDVRIETLLKLKTELLQQDAAALVVLADSWEEEGRPTEPERLIHVLKTTMDRCVMRHLTYPRVFLLRKAQLKRKEFMPYLGFTGAPLRFAVPQHPKIPADWIRAAAKEFDDKLILPQGARGAEVVLLRGQRHGFTQRIARGLRGHGGR